MVQPVLQSPSFPGNKPRGLAVMVTMLRNHPDMTMLCLGPYILLKNRNNSTLVFQIRKLGKEVFFSLMIIQKPFLYLFQSHNTDYSETTPSTEWHDMTTLGRVSKFGKSKDTIWHLRLQHAALKSVTTKGPKRRLGNGEVGPNARQTSRKHKHTQHLYVLTCTQQIALHKHT